MLKRRRHRRHKGQAVKPCYEGTGLPASTSAKEPNPGILECVKRAGSQKALARDMGYTQPAVSKWIRRGCSTRLAIDLAKRYDVPLELIRPDVAKELLELNRLVQQQQELQ